MIKLVVQSGPHQGHIFVPPPGVQVDIGRGRDCFVRIEGKKVSRKHASLIPREKDYILLDPGSRNGTFVNGERVQQKLLRSGDSIRVGDVEFSYLQEEQDPWIGKMIAGYRILERIGAGGMGTVYRAHQVAMDRTVAIKILSEKLSKDREFVSRFVDEARSMARVSHPHVVQVHNVGQHEGLFYLSMEYLEGGSLRQLLEREGALPCRRAVVMILDATKALVWAKEQGIVHRDIKPQNLLIDRDGRVKVADFGLAADLTKSSTLRDEGQVLGSPHFMAPEQALGRSVDHRADIYALGSTLYMSLSGKKPYEGHTVKEVLLAKMHGDPIPLATAAPDVPPKLQSIVARAMARDPETRYQSASELQQDLSKVLSSLSVTTAQPRKALSQSAKPLRRRSAERRGPTRTAYVALGVGGLVVAAALAAWIVIGGRGGQPGADVGAAGLDAPPDSPEAIAPTSSTQPTSHAQVPGKSTDRSVTSGVAEETNSGRQAGTTRRPEGTESPTRMPPERRQAQDALLALIAAVIEPLILESRFREATDRLEKFRTDHPDLASEVEEELREVRAAETLFMARKKAMELERRGDLLGAAGALRGCLESLPEPYRAEAQAAVESLERKAKHPDDKPAGSG